MTTTNAERPAPDDPRKLDAPTDLTKRSWMFVFRKTWREFSADECTDHAAALTYYAVLAILPAAVALVALVSVFGQGQSTVDTLLDILRDVGSSDSADKVEPTLQRLVNSESGGIALLLGLVGALWSASGYVSAFGRALNQIYDIREGRPTWKLRPVQILVTVVMLVLVAIGALILVLTGPVAKSVGDAIGLSSVAVTTWNIAKWPVLAVVVVVIVGLLYHATSNVKQPKIRWLSIGAIVAILTWAVASALFGLYVANFSSYDKTYGSLAGTIVFLLWLWITNLALLFGAELNSEIERGRELQSGIAAEESVQLPMRDTRKIDKIDKERAKDVERGRALRESRGKDADPGE